MKNRHIDSLDQEGIDSTHGMILAVKKLRSLLYDFCHDKAKSEQTIIGIEASWKDELKNFSEFIRGEYAEVTYTIIQNKNEFSVFETLNDRGQQLDIYELTRNVMISCASRHGISTMEIAEVFDSDIKENCSTSRTRSKQKRANAGKMILDCWNMQIENKDSSGKYMRNFLDFIKKPTSEGGFYRSGANGKENFTKYLDVLKTSSFAFSELINPDLISAHDCVIPGSDSEKKQLSRQIKLFNKTNFKQFYSLYLALRYKKAHASIISKYILLIEKIYMNLIFTFKRSPSEIEKELSSFAYSIFSINGLDDNLNVLYETHENTAKQLVDDVGLDFKKQFAVIDASSNGSKYVLRKIIQNTISFDASIDILHPEIQLEHILPNQYREHWSEVDFYVVVDENGNREKFKLEDKMPGRTNNVHKHFINKLGNFTLLIGQINSQASNKSFISKKQDYYNTSNLPITSGRTKLAVNYYSKWDAQSIIDRQEALAVEAEKIWKLV